MFLSWRSAIKAQVTFKGIRMASTSAKKLAGKIAVVTASTDGIGYAIAKRLGSDGATVVVSSRKETNVNKAVENLSKDGLNVHGVVCHVSKKDHRENLFKETINKFGAIDILVSNAAVNPTMGGVLDCDDKAWDKIFEVNVKNALQLSKEAVPHLQKRPGSSIVFVSSIAGIHPFPVLGAYSVSKTALLGLTKALAIELAPDVRVNCLCPGIVKTQFSSSMTSNPAIIDKMLESIPMGRLAVPDEMGGMVSFLVSDDASYVTGENFLVAGGMPSRL